MIWALRHHILCCGSVQSTSYPHPGKLPELDLSASCWYLLSLTPSFTPFPHNLHFNFKGSPAVPWTFTFFKVSSFTLLINTPRFVQVQPQPSLRDTPALDFPSKSISMFSIVTFSILASGSPYIKVPATWQLWASMLRKASSFILGVRSSTGSGSFVLT